MSSFRNNAECIYCCNHNPSTESVLRSHESRYHKEAIAASHNEFDSRYKEPSEGMPYCEVCSLFLDDPNTSKYTIAYQNHEQTTYHSFHVEKRSEQVHIQAAPLLQAAHQDIRCSVSL